jgi:adenylate cyclase
MEPRVTVAEEVEKEKAVPVWRRKSILAGGVALVLVVIALAVWNFYFRPTVEPASVEKMAFPLPDEPSIAVLPFTNMSGDPQQEYLGDGLTEQIITSLSMAPRLLVIARNSTFTYKGKAVKVQQVAEELGVRYVLEGSVQRSGERIRISAQLIDALTGRHLWAKRYDRNLKDLFALQDEITLKIMSAIQVKLTKGETARLGKKDTDNHEAYIKVMQGSEYFFRFNKEGNIRARKLYEEAIALDPEYATAYFRLGQTHYMDPYFRLSKSPRKSYQEAAKLLQKALAIDESHPMASSLLAIVYAMQRQHEKSLAQAERAVALYPDMAVSNVNLGGALFRVGRYEEAIQSLEKGIRLDPKGPWPYFAFLGQAYCYAGRYEEAIAALKRGIDRAPDSWLTHTTLAAIYSMAGHAEKARAEVAEVLRLDPKFSLRRYAKIVYWRKAELEPWIAALSKAGLPENPPLPLPDKPSIAVLPFVNVGGTFQEYLCDGITENIITSLSKTPKLFVIARNSSFTYKGKPVRVQQIGRELGVRYILDGSIQRYVTFGVSPERDPLQKVDSVRITAQLVDTATGQQLWAERYDRELNDIFAVQDEITKKILTALQLKLTEGEEIRVYAKGTDNLEAYLKFLQGRRQFNRYNKETNAMAKQLAKEVIALDPEYAAGYSLLAKTHYSDVVLKSTSSPRKSLDLATEMAQKAITLDPSLADAHGLLGFLYTMRRQHDKGIHQAEKAIALNPNSATAYHWYGLTLVYAGRHEEAITFYKKAIRLNPFPPPRFYMSLAVAYSFAGRYEEAIAAARKAIDLEPDNLFGHACMARCYALMGREGEARAEAKEVLRIAPKFSVVYLAKQMPYKYEADRQSVIESLRKAGLPD